MQSLKANDKRLANTLEMFLILCQRLYVYVCIHLIIKFRITHPYVYKGFTNSSTMNHGIFPANQITMKILYYFHLS